MARLAVAAAAALALLAVPALADARPAAATRADAAAPATKIRVLRPFRGARLAAGLRYGRTLRGSCSSGSNLVGRPDAWFCGAGGSVDPCFSSSPESQSVACFESPWDRRPIRLRLEEPLPRDLAGRQLPPRGDPWAMVLRDGTRCTRIRGLSAIVGGLRVNYTCDRRGGLVGNPRRGRTWSIKLWSGPGAKTPLPRVRVAVAWY